MSEGRNVRGWIGLVAGPILCVATLILAPPEGMTVAAWRATGAGMLMATWWLTEAIPIPATALVPLVLFPILGILPIAESASPYANPVIFLFLGGFIIARALETSGLHRRIALYTISLVGTRPANLVGGFMAATAFMSMWVSNTATMVMMYPMAMSAIDLAERERGAPDPRFATAMLLGVAYAASIGGIGTLIGTPPNALLAGFMSETYGRTIGFGQWMLLGVPLVVVSLPLAWLLLVRWLHPLSDTAVTREHTAFGRVTETVGPMSRTEWVVGLVTLVTAAAWIARPLIARVLPGISDAGISIAGALLMFLIPVQRGRLTPALTWDDAERLPWSVLVLFGGGLSLADALSNTGVATWMGESMSAAGTLPILVTVALITTVVVALSELASNTATAAVFLPIAGSLAVGMGADPMVLAVPTALAASCGFMLPVGTPPNAIAFASGRISVPQMARAGFWIDLLLLVLLNVAVFLLAGRVFGAS